MDRIVGYCGLVCTDCEAYRATQAEDGKALERVVVRWREEYHKPDITIESVMCDGCLGQDGRHCYHCYQCGIRACGMAKGLVNCAHCPDYACEKLQGFFGSVPRAREVLDEIRHSL